MMARIRNPSGNSSEWTGSWSDGSREWTAMKESGGSFLGLTCEADGEFWMEYSDFLSEFSRLDMCHLDPGTHSAHIGKSEGWETSEVDGDWKKHVSAGGCRKFRNTFHTNPQIEMRLDEEDDEADGEKGCTILIGLMQKDRRKQKEMGLHNLTIGFAIYEYEDDTTRLLSKEFFQHSTPKANSHTFLNAREITGSFKLPRGRYCIIPSTFKPEEEGKFLLRIYSLKPCSLLVADEQTAVVRHPEQQPLDELPASAKGNMHIYNKFKIVSGRDLEVNAWELQEVLNQLLTHGSGVRSIVSVETSKSIIASFDADRSGKLNFEEFQKLWTNLREWQHAFEKYDMDSSGTLSCAELRNVLVLDFGIRISNELYKLLAIYYGNKQGLLTFDKFLACVVKLKHLIESKFHEEMSCEDLYSLNEFLKVAMYS